MPTNTRILTKKNSVSGDVPTASDLFVGELAVNVVDKRLYTKNSTDVVEIGTNPTSVTTASVDAGHVSVETLSAATGITSNGLTVSGLGYPTVDGTDGQVLTTNGSGALAWQSVVQQDTTYTAGTNLTLSETTFNLNDSLTGLTDVATSAVSIGDWEIKLDGNDLRFVYNGTDAFKITTTGAVVAKDEITAFGAP